MGKVSGAGCGRGWPMQSLWVLAAYAFARYMWRRGYFKPDSAFGG